MRALRGGGKATGRLALSVIDLLRSISIRGALPSRALLGVLLPSKSLLAPAFLHETQGSGPQRAVRVGRAREMVVDVGVASQPVVEENHVLHAWPGLLSTPATGVQTTVLCAAVFSAAHTPGDVIAATSVFCETARPRKRPRSQGRRILHARALIRGVLVSVLCRLSKWMFYCCGAQLLQCPMSRVLVPAILSQCR